MLLVPCPFAQFEIDCMKDGAYAAISFNFSSNFSHTLGTAKKMVGLAHINVYTNVPAIASGLAK